MNTHWPKVPLGELLKKSEDWIELDPTEQYKEVTVRLWGKGVVLRQEISGAEIATKRRLRVKVGQFILSRIDARNGAFGLIPPKLDGAVVSNDFPVFEVNESRLLSAFLGWLSRTAAFVDFCRQASEGTTNRVRLKEAKFLATPIALPPLTEQQRIVAKIAQLTAKVEEAQTLQNNAEDAINSLVDAVFRKILNENEKSVDWQHKPIPYFAQINPRRDNVKFDPMDDVTFVPMTAVDEKTGTIVQPPIRKFLEVAKGYTYFKEGDVIFARITPCMQNGKSALVRDLLNGIAFGSTEFHVLRPGSQILGEWLHNILRSKDFRKNAEASFKGTAGQQRVPAIFLEQKIIPVPPIEEQRRIVAYLDTLHAKLDALKRLHAATQANLDALLPSILDKAFKGEL